MHAHFSAARPSGQERQSSQRTDPAKKVDCCTEARLSWCSHNTGLGLAAGNAMNSPTLTRGIAAIVAAFGLGGAWAPAPVAAAVSNLSPGQSVKFRPIAQLPRSSSDPVASVANIVNMTRHPALPSSLQGSAYNAWLTVADSRGSVYLVNVGSYQAGVTNATRTILNLRTATQGLDIGNATSGNSEIGLRWVEYHPISPGQAPRAISSSTRCPAMKSRRGHCRVPRRTTTPVILPARPRSATTS